MARPRKRERRDAAGRHGRAAAVPPPEFSRLADVSRIGRHEHRMTIAATAEERAALARRFDLVELALLEAELVLKKRGDGLVELSGRCRARFAQTSVVSLEPVRASLDAPLRSFYGGRLGDAPEADPLDEEGWPEPIEAGRIDVGEAVAQWLAVSLDPYPRLPDEAADAAPP
jgi:hypothetical protein